MWLCIVEPRVNFTVGGPIPQNAPILTQAGPAIGLDRPQRESRVNMDDDDFDTAEPIARRGGRLFIRHPGNNRLVADVNGLIDALNWARW